MKTLAIDQGTTSTRGILVDETGQAELLFSAGHRQIYPKSGWVEHDGEELIRNLRACLDAASEVKDLGAVGIANQGESCLAWNAATREPLGPVIVWQDDRTKEWIEALRRDGAAPLVQERAGLPLDTYFSASKLGWILRAFPEATALAAKGQLRLGTTDAFFRDRLTGRFETDVATASRTSLMNLATCQWDADLCRLFDVPLEALPTITPNTGDLGTVRCGTRAIPLTASIVDQQASLYGNGCRQAGDAKMTFGTGAFALTVTGPHLDQGGGGALPTVAWQRAGLPTIYALDGGIYAASSAINWARNLGLCSNLSQISAFENPPSISRGLAFVPALAGLACPHWDRIARGAWMGLSLDTSPSDMMQAILEGIAFRMAEVVEAMEARQSLNGPIPMDGGMSANGYFCQFLANTLNRELIISEQPELTAIGTAALAAEAADRPFALQRKGKRIVPDEHSADFRQIFEAARLAVQSFGARKPGGPA